MIKRVNFTGRKRIARERIDIRVVDGVPRTFDAAIDIESLGFLSEAAVILEATSAGSVTVQRFHFGRVDQMEPPEDRRLGELSGENVFFTLKVIDQTERFGRILGIADNLRPSSAGNQTATGRRGILPVDAAPLGDELWRLSFREQDVFLLVNEDISQMSDRVRFDPVFYAVTYPNVIRTIFIRSIEENVDIHEDDDRWPILWLRFGMHLHPNRAQPPNSDSSQEAKDEWIDDVVDQFCKMHELKQKYCLSEHVIQETVV